MNEQTRKEMKQKLANYRQPAPDVDWGELEKALGPRRKTNMAALWGKRVAAAAVVLFAIGMGWKLISTDHPTDHPKTAMTNPTPSVSSTEPSATSAPSTTSAAPAPTMEPTASVPPASVTPTNPSLSSVRASDKSGGQPSKPVVNSVGKSAADGLLAEANKDDHAPRVMPETAGHVAPMPDSGAETANKDDGKKSVDEQNSENHALAQDVQGPKADTPRMASTIDIPVMPRPEGEWRHGSSSKGNRLMAQVYYANSMSGGSSMNSISPSLGPARLLAMASYNTAANYNNVMLYDQNFEVEENVHHHQPIRFGVSVRYGLNKRWSLESGLTYTYLVSDITRTVMDSPYQIEQRLSYIGVPLNVNYLLWGNRHFNVYASAGGMVETMVWGKRMNEEYDYNERVGRQPVQFSVQGAAGVEYVPGGNLSIYAEPGIAYHFANHGNVPTFYQDKPLGFNLNLGLRFSFSK